MASKKPIIRCKYEEGEKVLCYEPDPAKTRVLYNSKVLKIVHEKDDIGHKYYKFLIHFQGWNSTWDRYVTDEFILKDTEENRKLQKKLAEEAQLTPGGNLYRKERKKRTKNETKSSSSTEPPKKSVKKETSKKSTVESNGTSLDYSDTILLPKRRLPDLKFPKNLKYHTGYNCYLTHNKNMLVRLPCSPNVVTLLENFLKYLARNFYFIDKKSTKGLTRHENEKFDRKQIEKRYKLCVEFLDGLRICFNTYLNRRLLINEEERAQFQEAIKIEVQPPVTIIQESYKPKFTDVQNGSQPDTDEDNENNVRSKGKQENGRSSISHSSKICSECGLADSHCSQVFHDLFKKARDVNILKADQWKAVPESVYYEEEKQPAIIYGAYHLLRLLEQLPKLLTFTEIEGERLSVVYSFSNELLNYLSTQTQLFGMEKYLNAERAE